MLTYIDLLRRSHLNFRALATMGVGKDGERVPRVGKKDGMVRVGS